MTSCCKHGKKSSGSIRGAEFLDELSDSQLLKKSAPWGYVNDGQTDKHTQLVSSEHVGYPKDTSDCLNELCGCKRFSARRTVRLSHRIGRSLLPQLDLHFMIRRKLPSA